MREQKKRVAILGAGPAGLEAALAATSLDLPFVVYEAGPGVASNIRAWSHVRLFSPWDLNVSPRMRGHLEAAGREVPSGSMCPTGSELVERLLEPLSRLPEIAGALRLGTRVISVSRSGLLKNDEIATPARAQSPFRLLLADRSGNESIEHAEVVLDCTGNYDHPNRLGDGGIPAPGERGLESEITRHLPDILGERVRWSGQRTLLVGAGFSAQTAAVDLARLAREDPATRIVWALRSRKPSFEPDPGDALPERARLMIRAQAILDGGSAAFEIVPGVVVDSLRRRDTGIVVALRADEGNGQRVEVDRILSLTGYVGDNTIYRQLQVHECWATSGPMKLAAALLGAQSADCLTQGSHGPDTLVHPEPDFFVLGSKSYGRNSTFLMKVGWDQVDEVFSLIAPPSGVRNI